MEQWGKDHWTNLAYIECRCVDYRGELEARRMRINPARHPLLVSGSPMGDGPEVDWASKYSTRYKGGAQLVPGHDDWDCIEDMETGGILVITSTSIPAVSLTRAGMLIAADIRQHKMGGKPFATYEINPILIPRPDGERGEVPFKYSMLDALTVAVIHPTGLRYAKSYPDTDWFAVEDTRRKTKRLKRIAVWCRGVPADTNYAVDKFEWVAVAAQKPVEEVEPQPVTASDRWARRARPETGEPRTPEGEAATG